MTTTLFRRVTRLAPRPPPVAVAVPVPAAPAYAPAPVVVPVFSRTPSVPEVSPRPKPADLEDVPTRFKFAMQEIRISTHSTEENKRLAGAASLVGGR